MPREITRRELRNESGEIMREVDQWKSFIVAIFRTAPPVDYERFREDLDTVADQDAAPRA